LADFFSNLDGIQRFFYFVAIPATVILIIQTIITILGLGDADDFDLDVDIDDIPDDIDGIADFRFFSIRGLIAFFTIFGWVGIVLYEQSMPLILNLLISTISGFVAMFLIGYLFYSINKLQSDGTIRIRNAIGNFGEVYIPIPANRKGVGKIQLLLQERYIEVDAVTDANEDLKTGTIVKVIDAMNINTLVVQSTTDNNKNN